MKLFIAGASSQRLRIREIIDAAIALGHEVTYDWTRAPEWDLGRDLTLEEGIDVSRLNREGVDSCDGVLWVVDRAHPSLGSQFEAGYALGRVKPIAQVFLASYEVPTSWIHALDFTVRHGSVESAIETIEGALRRRPTADVPGQILLAEVAL